MNLSILVDPIITNRSHRDDSPRFSLKAADIAALEVGLDLKSRGFVQEISIFCVTEKSDENNQALLYCFALGVTEVIRICSDANQLWDKHHVASIIYNVIAYAKSDLIFCGSSDYGSAPVGSFLAALAGYPFIGGAIALETTALTSNIFITRKLGEKYTETINCQIPCVIGINPTISRPTVYPSIKLIKHSKINCIIQRDSSASDVVFRDYNLSIEEKDYQIPVQVLLDYPGKLSALDRIKYLSQGSISQVRNSKITVNQETGIKNTIDILISKVEILQD